MRSARTLLVLTTLVLTGLGRPAAADDVARVLMRKADRLYARRGAGQGPAALATYEKVLAIDPASVEARWKICRTYHWLGTGHRARRPRLDNFERAIRYCQEGLDREPRCTPCLFYLGVCYGLYGETQGILVSLGMIPHVQDAMNAILKIDPTFAQGGAHLVLGRLYHKLPAFKGGDNGKAISYLRRAIELGPNRVLAHVYLAEVLLDEGKRDEARARLEYAIDLPESQMLPDEIPESKKAQEVGRKLYRARFGER